MKNLEAFISGYCDVCKKKVNLEQSLYHHNLQYYCQICEQYFRENYRYHACPHFKEQQTIADEKRLFCDSCEAVFFSKESVDKHQEDYHGRIEEDDLLNCRCCREEFKTRHEMGIHLKGMERTIINPNTMCNLCMVNFESADVVAKHKKEKHGKYLDLFKKIAYRSRECPYCYMLFSTTKDLKSHRLKHHKYEQLTCFCGKIMILGEIRQHYMTHLTQKYWKTKLKRVCDICGCLVKDLVDHLRLRHENKREFKCAKCLQDFKKKWMLVRHIRNVHQNGTNQYPCLTCGVLFKESYNLKVHMRRHEKIKPFSCLICEKTFTTKQSRDNHMKTHKMKVE